LKVTVPGLDGALSPTSEGSTDRFKSETACRAVTLFGVSTTIEVT
jgi:hypothetical protein